MPKILQQLKRRQSKIQTSGSTHVTDGSIVIYFVKTPPQTLTTSTNQSAKPMDMRIGVGYSWSRSMREKVVTTLLPKVSSMTVCRLVVLWGGVDACCSRLHISTCHSWLRTNLLQVLRLCETSTVVQCAQSLRSLGLNKVPTQFCAPTIGALVNSTVIKVPKLRMPQIVFCRELAT